MALQLGICRESKIARCFPRVAVVSWSRHIRSVVSSVNHQVEDVVSVQLSVARVASDDTDVRPSAAAL